MSVMPVQSQKLSETMESKTSEPTEADLRAEGKELAKKVADKEVFMTGHQKELTALKKRFHEVCRRLATIDMKKAAGV